MPCWISSPGSWPPVSLPIVELKLSSMSPSGLTVTSK